MHGSEAPPVDIGDVADVASGKIEQGWCPLEGLLSSESIYPQATLYDRPRELISVFVQSVEPGVVTATVHPERLAAAEECLAGVIYGNDGPSYPADALQIAREIRTYGPRTMRVI